MAAYTTQCLANMLSMVVLSKSLCDASLLTVTRSSVAVIGDRVELKCSVDGNQNVIWGFKSFNTSTETDFYFGTEISLPFKSRFKIDKNISGQHNLIIDSVDLNHAGRYQCVTITTGSKPVAHLTVLESSPQCSANITNKDNETGKNASLWMWCRITYTGNMIPVFNWTKDDNMNDIIATNTNTSGQRTILMTTTSLVVRQLHIEDHGAVFKCSVTFQLPSNSMGNAPNYEYTWPYNVSARSNDLYGPRNLSIVRYGDRLVCSADGNPPPTYRWTHIETNTVKKGYVLLLDPQNDKESTFQCTAYNKKANATKSFTVQGSSSGSGPSLRTIVAAAFGGASFLLLLVIIIVSSYLVSRKKQRGFMRTRVSSFGQTRQTVIDEPDIIDVDIYSHGSNACRESENHRAVSEDFPVYTDVKKGNESLTNNSCTAFSFGDDNFSSTQGPVQKKKKQNRVGADGTIYVDLSEVKQPTFRMSTTRAATPRASFETNYALIDHTTRIPPPPPQTEF